MLPALQLPVLIESQGIVHQRSHRNFARNPVREGYRHKHEHQRCKDNAVSNQADGVFEKLFHMDKMLYDA